jgi:hypothetical protein
LIPRAYIQAWSTRAPWPDLRQVEQDLIISRALCDLFSAYFGNEIDVRNYRGNEWVTGPRSTASPTAVLLFYPDVADVVWKIESGVVVVCGTARHMRA